MNESYASFCSARNFRRAGDLMSSLVNTLESSSEIGGTPIVKLARSRVSKQWQTRSKAVWSRGTTGNRRTENPSGSKTTPGGKWFVAQSSWWDRQQVVRTSKVWPRAASREAICQACCSAPPFRSRPNHGMMTASFIASSVYKRSRRNPGVRKADP